MEEYDFQTYLEQLAPDAWIVLAMSVIGIALHKVIIKHFYKPIGLIDMADTLWSSLVAFLGGKPSNTIVDGNQSYKIVVFTSLIIGTIVWAFYRSQMNAVLSIRSEALPFQDLESLAKTDWRY